MTDEQRYNEVSRIVGSIEGFIGTYLATNFTALQNGQIIADTFADQMRIAVESFDSAITELSLLRFPRASHRKAHVKIKASLIAYRKAIQSTVRAVSTGNTAYWRDTEHHLTHASALADKYFSLVFRDRIKEGAK